MPYKLYRAQMQSILVSTTLQSMESASVRDETD